MNISPVAGRPDFASAPSSAQNAIKLLEKQKDQLLDQVQKVKESDMDFKIKQEKIKALNEQITEIDAQICQKRAEKLNPDHHQNSKNTADYETEKQSKKFDRYSKGESINSEYMFSAVSGYSDLKAMGKVRTNLQNELRLATSSGKNPEAGKGIQQKLDKLEGDMMKKGKKIKVDLKKAAQDAVKPEKQEAEDADEIKEIKKLSETEVLQGKTTESVEDKIKDKSVKDQSRSEKGIEEEEPDHRSKRLEGGQLI